MNRSLKKMLVIAGSTIPALAMLAGTASAGVSANNKLKNGDFSAGANHWAAVGMNGAKVQVHAGVLYAGNMKDAVAATTVHVTQCVKVSPSTQYEMSGKIRIPSGQDRSGSANLKIMYFASENCTNLPLAQHETTPVNELNAWKLQKKTTQAPAAAHSAMVRLHVTKNMTIVPYYAEHSFHAAFDDIQLLAKNIIIAPPPVPDPDPEPEPEDEPAQEEPAPEDEPAPDPAPEDEPAPEAEDESPTDEAPVEEGETVEEPVDGPELPELPSDDGDDTPADAGDDTPAAQGDDDGAGSDAPSQPQNSGNSTGNDDSANEGEEAALEGDDSDAPGGSNTSSGIPTPAAPETGNASGSGSGFGPTEIAVAAAAGLTLLGLAFVAGSRRRKDEPAEARFE